MLAGSLVAGEPDDVDRRGPARPAVFEGRSTVKKLLLLAVAGAGGVLLWRKREADKAEQALWAEVTDPVK